MAEQYRVDAIQLHVLDLDFLADQLYDFDGEDGWHQKIETHLNKFIKRVLRFEADVTYVTGSVSSGGDVVALLSRALSNAYTAFKQLTTARSAAWTIRADSVPDLYEHAIQTVEKQIFVIEQEQKLIAGLGLKDYIASRLENE